MSITQECGGTVVTFTLYGPVSDERAEREYRLAAHRARQLSLTLLSRQADDDARTLNSLYATGLPQPYRFRDRRF